MRRDMSPKHVAFLRAINVGGRRLTMEELRKVIEDGGFRRVETYQASGNVVFDADAPTAEMGERLESHLEDTLDYDVPCFVRTLEELADVVEREPFDKRIDRCKRYVVFTREPLSETQVDQLDQLANDVDSFRSVGREIHWQRDLEAGDTMPTSEIEKTLDLVGTRRTLGTVERIVEKWG